MATHLTTPRLHAEIETYCDHGTWFNRRHDCTKPFASGESREQLIAIGVEVARWNSLRHVIRDPDGTIAEINTYDSGPYPARSPVRREHPSG